MINYSIRTYKQNAMASYSRRLESSNYVETQTGAAIFHGEALVPKEWADCAFLMLPKD